MLGGASELCSSFAVGKEKFYLCVNLLIRKAKSISFTFFLPCSVLIDFLLSGVRPRDMWLVCLCPVYPGACFVGVASCRINGGRHAQQQILPRQVRSLTLEKSWNK